MKKIILAILCMSVFFISVGCSVEKISTEKLRDVEFTVVPKKDIPEELVKKLYTDKKVRGGKLRFVFQKGIGEMMCFGDDVYSTEITEEEARRAILSLC